MITSVETEAGRISIEDTGGTGTPLVLLHGNSASNRVFLEQLREFGDRFRVVAPDYSGHGASDDARRPEQDYTLSGHARTMAAVLAASGVVRPVLVGVSLGGHVALELAATIEVAALMLVGSPPFAKSMDSIGQAFQPGPGLVLSGQEQLSAADVDMFLSLIQPGDAEATAAYRSAIQRTDGRARAVMASQLLAEDARDQRQIAIGIDAPIALVNGAEDGVVNLDYMEGVPYRRPWRGGAHRIAGAVHAPQSSHPAEFNALLSAFLDEL